MSTPLADAWMFGFPLKDIIIKGGKFATSTTLQGVLTNPMNIIYGTNGSGKTTLSKGLRALSKGERGDIEAHVGHDLSELERQNIFVYNEQFIDENVKMRSDGLGSIVMLGNQVNWDEEKQRLEAERKEMEEYRNDLMGEMNKLEARRNELSTKITSLLTDVKEMEKQTKGMGRKPSYDEGEIAKFEQAAEATDLESLIAEIGNGMRRLEASRNGVMIDWQAPTTGELRASVQRAIILLSEAMEEPQMTERDMMIMSLTKNAEMRQMVDESRKYIINLRLSTCPLCQQSVSDEHRAELARSIEKVLSHKVEEHQKELDELVLKVQPQEMETREWPDHVFDAESAALNAAYIGLTKECAKLKEAIKQKKDNPFEAIEYERGAQLLAQAQKMDEATEGMKAKIAAFNNDVIQRKNLAQEMVDKNKMKCWKVNSADFREMRDITKEKKKIQDGLSEVDSDLKKNANMMKVLQANKEKVDTAMFVINDMLNIVFMGEKRLSLSYDDADKNHYRLKSRGQDVTPDKISTGERNILALAYFFAHIGKDQEESKKYSLPKLIVIDDPISSFDSGNNMGVLELLKSEIGLCLQANRKSKVLLLTHDLRTANSMVTIYETLSHRISTTQNCWDDPSIYELHTQRMMKKNAANKSHYQQLLKNIYSFVNTDNANDIKYLSIGNQMREVMETFAKINYNSSYVEIFDNNNVKRLGLSNLSNADIYRNALMRLMGNSMSHSSAISDVEGFEYKQFSNEELRSYAQRILMLMYELNPDHIYGFLGNDIGDDINQWTAY